MGIEGYEQLTKPRLYLSTIDIPYLVPRIKPYMIRYTSKEGEGEVFMNAMMFYTSSVFLLIILTSASSVATASISNNNIGSTATGSNSNSTSILSNNSGTIGAQSNGNTQPHVNNATVTNEDTTQVFESNASKEEPEGVQSNSDLPANATQ